MTLIGEDQILQAHTALEDLLEGTIDEKAFEEAHVKVGIDLPGMDRALESLARARLALFARSTLEKGLEGTLMSTYAEGHVGTTCGQGGRLA